MNYSCKLGAYHAYKHCDCVPLLLFNLWTPSWYTVVHRLSQALTCCLLTLLPTYTSVYAECDILVCWFVGICGRIIYVWYSMPFEVYCYKFGTSHRHTHVHADSAIKTLPWYTDPSNL